MRQVLCPTLVGRDEETRCLGDALDAAQAGRGGTLFLVGEAGIGKSRLVRVAVAEAAVRGMATLTGRAVATLRRVLDTPEVSAGHEIVTYCTIGGRAATAWFILTHLLGHDGVRVYDGSWAEWGRLPDTPVS